MLQPTGLLMKAGLNLYEKVLKKLSFSILFTLSIRLKKAETLVTYTVVHWSAMMLETCYLMMQDFLLFVRIPFPEWVMLFRIGLQVLQIPSIIKIGLHLFSSNTEKEAICTIWACVMRSVMVCIHGL